MSNSERASEPEWFYSKLFEYFGHLMTEDRFRPSFFWAVAQEFAVRVGPPPEDVEELDEFAETKAGLRSHIAKFWKDDGPNQKIRLSLPRWLWDELLARTMRGGGPPREPTEEAPDLHWGNTNVDGLVSILAQHNGIPAQYIRSVAALLHEYGVVASIGGQPRKSDAERQVQIQSALRLLSSDSQTQAETAQTDADLLDGAADYIESMVADMQFNVPEPEASQASACRRVARALRGASRGAQ